MFPIKLVLKKIDIESLDRVVPLGRVADEKSFLETISLLPSGNRTVPRQLSSGPAPMIITIIMKLTDS